jgi:hypothetical protein
MNMKIFTAILFFCALGMASLALPAWAGERSVFFGVWQGMVTQVQVAGSRYTQYEVNIRIVPGDYHLDYPGLGCGGRLELLHKEKKMVQFHEELEYGKEKCSGGGRTVLRFIRADIAEYLWFDDQGELKVQGLLKRQQQVMT